MPYKGTLKKDKRQAVLVDSLKLGPSSAAHRKGATTKSRPPRTKGEVESKGKLILIGSSQRAAEIHLSLAILSVNIVRVSDEIEAVTHADSQTVGFLVIGPFGKRKVSSVCDVLLDYNILHNVPILVVVSDRTEAKEERRLYRQGVEAVFEYPSEKRELPRLVMEILSLPAKGSTLLDTDRVIRNRVKQRIKSESGIFGKNISIAVSDGIVSASGELDAYWKVKRLEKTIAGTPNVRAVFVAGVTLRTKKESDKKLEKNIAELVKMSSKLSLRTLDISVTAGEVELRGSAKDGHEIQRLEDIISQMNGVHKVKATVVVSPEQVNRDSATASSITSFFTSLYPKGDVTVAVFGGVVILRGRVLTLAQIIDASQAVKRMPGVKKVVNKLRIYPTRKSKNQN
jgi:osmotically-inducible protein OsmY